MAEQVSLEEALKSMNEQVDNIIAEMRAAKVPEVTVMFTGTIVRTGYASIIAAHGNKVPVTDVDEAMVSSIATLLLEYIGRVQPKNNKRKAIEHAQLMINDISERLGDGINAKFTDGLERLKKMNRH